MGMFSLVYKPQKPRGFSFTPRYFNPEKERRETREKLIRQEILIESGERIEDSDYIPNIRGQFKAKNHARTRVIHKQNIRILLIFNCLSYSSARIV